jgi:excisionase family DNA binding protein
MPGDAAEKQVIDREDPLFTPNEVAEYLNCSVSFLAKERMKGTGPAFVRIGRAIRYSRSALDSYKAANTRVSTSQYCDAHERQPRE